MQESPRSAVQRARLRNRVWSIFVYIVIGVIAFVWISSLFFIARDIPPPWGWLAVLGWVFAGPLLLYIGVLILRPLERRFLSAADRQLGLEV